MKNYFQHSWARAWDALGAQDDGSALMEQVLQCYRQPQRKYHTLQHLKECLDKLAPHLRLAEQPAEVEMALWFHDAIYEVQAGDNEAKSAAWAALELHKAKVKPDSVLRVEGLIMATRHAVLPETPDQKLLVDVDLSILGAAEPRYFEYEQQVRQEYSWVPEPLFRRKRAEILGRFLMREFIYHRAVFRKDFEIHARANLSKAIHRLGA